MFSKAPTCVKNTKASMSKQQSSIKSFFQRSDGAQKRPSSIGVLSSETSDILKSKGDKTSINENTSPNKNANKMNKSTKDKNTENPAPKKARVDKQITDEKTDLKENDQTEEIHETLRARIGVSWFEALEPEFRKPYFKTLYEFVRKVKCYTFNPNRVDIYILFLII